MFQDQKIGTTHYYGDDCKPPHVKPKEEHEEYCEKITCCPYESCTCSQEPKEEHLCELCGTLMPKGEEMFRYHGNSGDCPVPPKPQPPKEWEEKVEEAARTLWRRLEYENEVEAEEGLREIFRSLLAEKIRMEKMKEVMLANKRVKEALQSERKRIAEAVKRGSYEGGGGEFYDGPGKIYSDGWDAAFEKALKIINHE